MASDLAEQLERISDKSRLLLIRFGELQKRNAALTSELQDMRATLVARDAEIEKLRLELEFSAGNRPLHHRPHGVRAGQSRTASRCYDL